MRMVGGPCDRARGDLGLVDRRHRLRAARQPRLHNGELRRVQGRQLNHRDMHAAVLVQQLAADGLGEALDRVLRAAVRGLKRNPAVRERRADLHDRATVARHHARQCDPRPVHDAVIRHIGDALVLLRRDLPEGREHARHRVVDPHVHPAELRLDLRPGSLDLFHVGDVGRDRKRAPTELLDLCRRRFQAVFAPRQDADAPAALGEDARGRAPDARRRPGDDDNFLRSHDASQRRFRD